MGIKFKNVGNAWNMGSLRFEKRTAMLETMSSFYINMGRQLLVIIQ